MNTLSERHFDFNSKAVILRFINGGCSIFTAAQDSEEYAEVLRRLDNWAMRRACELQTAVNRPAIETTLLAHALRDETGQAARLTLAMAVGYNWSTAEARALVCELQTWQASGADGGPIVWLTAHWRGRPDPYRRFVHRLHSDETVPRRTDFERVIRDCLSRLQGARRAA